MKPLLFIIIDLSEENAFEFNKNTFYDFAKELDSINFIDVSKILKLNQKTNTSSLDKRFIIHQPINILELKKMMLKNNSVFMYCINTDSKYFFINFLLARYKVKKFIVSNLGYNPENFNYFNKNFFQKIEIFRQVRLKYYFVRLLVFLNILPKIDFFFESSSFVINSINNGMSKKILKYFPKLNLSYYLNTIKINSRHYDSLIENRYENSEEYIVFIDGMVIDHKDTVMRGKISNENRQKYFLYINKFLSDLKKLYNKEVIICLHPKNDFSIAEKDFKDFKCVKFETEKFVSRAFLTVFHEGSNIVQAILLKKKIINLYGKLLGDHVNKRCELYSSMFGLKRFDFENYDLIDKNILIEDLNKITHGYDKYIVDNIVFDKSQKGIDQIINYLKLK